VSDLFLRRARRIDLTSLARDGYVVTTHNLTVYGMSGLCGATPDLQAPAPGGPKVIARTPMGDHSSDPRVTHN
jgi:hypothetical protein